MNDCPTCGLPMVWSEDHERVWCAVYGDHRERYAGRSVLLGTGAISSAVIYNLNRHRPHRYTHEPRPCHGDSHSAGVRDATA